MLLLLNIYLSHLKKKFSSSKNRSDTSKINPWVAQLFTGSLTGMLAGIFGVGGGLILVPFQMIFLDEKIKSAIQTSLGAIVFTSIFSTLGHYYNGNILLWQGILVGLGGLIAVQITARFLPKIPDRQVQLLFNSILILFAIYSFYLSLVAE